MTTTPADHAGVACWEGGARFGLEQIPKTLMYGGACQPTNWLDGNWLNAEALALVSEHEEYVICDPVLGSLDRICGSTDE
jgi:hypothetical protein